MTTAMQTTPHPTHLNTGDSPATPGTLTGEHAELMRDVTRRATPILALLDTRAWPHAELGTLAAYLRSAVLRQALNEEVLLYPHDAAATPIAELSADHVRLRTLIAQLERRYAQPCAPQDLRATIGDLLAALRRHLLDEQAVLAALPEAPAGVPSAAALVAGEQPWPSNDGPVLLPLETMPADQATELCVERLLRLRFEQRAEIYTGDGNTSRGPAHSPSSLRT